MSILATSSGATARDLQDRQGPEPFGTNKLAPLPATGTLTHPPRRLQIPAGAYNPPALCHHLDVFDLAQRMPQLYSLIPHRSHKGTTTTHSDSNQPAQNGCNQKKAVAHIIAAIEQQLEHIVLLNMATQTRRRRHQYSLLDAKFVIIASN